MSAQAAVYACTRLEGVAKRGVVKPDADGYYEIVVGGLGVRNSAGALYELAAGQRLFQASSSLMRRIEAGQLRGEYGHPKISPNMRPAEFFQRILTIEETRISHHIRKITLKMMPDPQTNQMVMCIIAELKPCGPYGPALKEQLDNGCENVAFSIRSITNDSWENGILVKRLDQIVTWDYVVEPGIHLAEKYRSPALESHERLLLPKNLVDLNEYRKQRGMGIESSGISVEQLMQDLGWDKVAANAPITLGW